MTPIVNANAAAAARRVQAALVDTFGLTPPAPAPATRAAR
jgi:hypothetical protein